MEVSAVAAANNKFCVDLFKTIFKDKKEENVFISPFSISQALAMAQLGARGTTAHGMANALCWSTENGDKIHEQFKAYITMLQSPSDKFSLSTANRIYMQQDYKIEEDFKTKSKNFYLAEPVSADFCHQSETERNKINGWVEEKTEDKIRELIPSGLLNSSTLMVLVNAIYFKGDWDFKFDESRTQPRAFKLSPGQTKNVPMMNAKRRYAINDSFSLQCRAIEIPYKDKDLSMVVVQPYAEFGLQDMIKELTQEKVEELVSRLRLTSEEMTLTLPKFEVTSRHSLEDHLVALGMSNAFDASKADFSGLIGTRDVCMSAVMHIAFVKVNEEGTEAAAATAGFMTNCMPIMIPPFVVDSPFLFLIKDNRANGTILFIGTVTDPSSQ